jgi:tetratricopeptide (TPR) repeat protein
MSRIRGAVIPVLTLVIYFAVSSFQINTIWKTEESFWRQSVKYGGTALAHANYGLQVARKDPKLAEYHYREALKLNPFHIYANINLGMLLIRQKQQAEGLALLKKIVAQKPNWALAHFWLSRGLRDTGQSKESLVSLRRAADLDPRRLAYKYEAASALQKDADHAASIGYLNRVLTFNPKYRNARFMLAWAKQKSGERDQAILVYQQLLKVRPNHVQAHFNLAIALRNESKCQDAIKHLERVLILRPSYSAAHWHLAKCYVTLENPDKAASHMRSYEQR